MTSETKQNIPSAEEQINFALEAKKIEIGKVKEIEILSKKYRLYPISNKIDAKIANLAFDALCYEREMKADNCSVRRMKKLNTKLRKIPSKMAAYYLLGRKAHILPFAWSVKWRGLYRKSEAISATINTVGATGEDKDFFGANSEVIKYLLALSMKGVGESVKQMLERKESAESMLDEDALPKKEEDSKSETPSKPVRKTKK